jgi:hypothetical protein
MALLLRNDLLYLHIPKTGGNWLTKLLHDHGCVKSSIEHKHASYDLVAGRLRRRSFIERSFTLRHIENLNFIAVVRNPLKWYESWFKYQNSRGFGDWGKVRNAREWHIMSSINSIKQTDFNDFVMAIHSAHPGFLTSLYAAYTARSAANVLKNESIRDDFAAINARFSLGIPESAIFESAEYGVSPKIPILWDQKVFETTVALERAAFSAYGYGTDDVVTLGV